MKKILNSLVGYLIVVALVFGLSIDTVKAVTNYTNDPALDPYDQVVYAGGTENSKWNSEGVAVSKTIEGTGVEDYFDITLQVKSKKTVKEIMESDSATVVFCIDLSNTMKNYLKPNDSTSLKKVDAAIAEVKKFTEWFNSASTLYPNNKIGAVGFNTNGYNLVSLTNVGNYASFNSTLESETNTRLSNAGTAGGFTNMEAGLKRAQTMLNGSKSKYKYIILLSDGVPTTYIKEGTSYSGYSFSSSNTTFDGYNNGITGKAVQYPGANYSDTGAKNARTLAMDMKKAGVKIYSVGVGLQTFDGYGKNSSENISYKNYADYRLNGEQLLVNQLSRAVIVNQQHVENTFGKVTGSTGGSAWSDTNKTKIFGKTWEITRNFESAVNGTGTIDRYRDLSENYTTTKNDDLFKKWLTYGIGSGTNYYIDVTNDAQFQAVASSISAQIEAALSGERSQLWSTTDPMTNYGTSTSEFIEFIGFLNASGNPITAKKITGSHVLNGNNTAEFKNVAPDSEGTITWDLKNSGYKTSTENNATVYTYTLKYRVRLKTDKQGFVKDSPYETNGTTTLNYVTVVTENNTTYTSDKKTINYPIPKVKGYLTELKITKLVEGIAPGKTLNDANANFEFTVNFKRNNQNVANTFTYDKYNADGSAAGNTQNITNGGKITLQNGQYAIIHSLFHDIDYTVAETNKDGFVKTIQSGSETGTTHTEVPLNEVTYKNKAYYLNMLKVDDTTGAALEGVRFSIYKTRNADGSFSNIVSSMNAGMSLQDLTTNGNGIIEFGNLPFTYGGTSTYYLVEEETIDKYNLLDNYVVLTVNGSGITATYNGEPMSLGNDGITITVPNAKGIDLPETGGMGETLFEVLGILFMLFSSVLYTLNKKANNNN